MKTNPITWFEIPANDIDRAKKFYETLLEIQLERRDFMGFEMVWFPSSRDLPGASGALMKGEGYVPSKGGSTIYFNCSDIDAALERAKTVGGIIGFPRKSVGEYGYIAWLEDSEGNMIALHTPKS